MDYISLNSNTHNSNLVDSLDHFKALNNFVDVTLVCEGHTLKAHKIILSAGSNVLHRLLIANPAKHPIIILAETKYDTLRLIMDFLYKGKIKIQKNDLKRLLSAAATFEINELKRLCEQNLNSQKADTAEPKSQSHSKPYNLRESSPKKKRQRRRSSDSDIVWDGMLLKREVNSSPCSSEEPEVVPSVQSDCDFQPQIAETRSLNKTSAESSTGSDSTAACTQNTQSVASWESQVQPLKELESNLVQIEPATIVVRSKYNEQSDDDSDTQKRVQLVKRKRSKIWAFYNAVDNYYARCKICGRKLSYRTTVSNLKKHLLSKHRKFDPKNPPKIPDVPLTRIRDEELEIFEEIDFSSLEEAVEQDGETIECEEVGDEDIPSTSTPCILKIT